MGVKTELFKGLINEMESYSTSAYSRRRELTSSEISVLRSAANIMISCGRDASSIIDLIDDCDCVVGRRNHTTYDTRMDLSRKLRNDPNFSETGNCFLTTCESYRWYVKVDVNEVRIENHDINFISSTPKYGCSYGFNGTSITSVEENTKWMTERERRSFRIVQDKIYQYLREI